MPISLFPHQTKAIEMLKTGSILCGGVGSGKSRTALAYYFVKECEGKIDAGSTSRYAPMKKPKDLYIITTARKRDTLDWEAECAPFLLSTNHLIGIHKTKVVIDSWNNINKYCQVEGAFFIFDEQRVVGKGAWVKAFLKICKKNNWIVLSATPGDCWMDYVPIFVANKFYKNKTEFTRRHVIYSPYSKYPKVDRYIETNRLLKFKKDITVLMEYTKETIPHHISSIAPYDKEQFQKVLVDRWNVFENRPIKTASELCYLLRKVVNSDIRRVELVKELAWKHKKVIIFYNYDYELALLKEAFSEIDYAEWNGHKHELIPDTNEWVYLVQYTAGAEGWNCVETNVVIFYSQNYSYKIMTQAAGRIDRLNTPFTELYYYHVRSVAGIDVAILKALKNKKNFNAQTFEKHTSQQLQML